ncbi:DUF2345 domain-containing protein [Iodobacter ciconiae]|uniref:DUF2345 domain-containing protein n=1 Tax=Iodobacter ciconiae TaxID=2496266 RepID=UPI003570DBDA
MHASKSFEADSNTDQDGKSQSKDQAGGQNIILLHGEDGVAITSPQSQTLTAGTNLDLIAQRDTNQTSGRRWIHNVGSHISLFVAGVKDKVALKLIAAKGKIQLQAQSDDVDITADKNVKITACKEKVEIAAGDEVLLTAGGGYIRLKGGNIEIHCPGEVSIKGASHELSGPTKLVIPFPEMPKVGPHSRSILFSSLEGVPMEGILIHMLDSEKKDSLLKATTSGNGLSPAKELSNSLQYDAIIGFDEWTYIFDDEVLNTSDSDEFNPGESDEDDRFEESQQLVKK